MLSEKVKITAAFPLLQVCTQRSLERLLTVTGWSVTGKSNYLYFLLSFVANRNNWPDVPTDGPTGSVSLELVSHLDSP